MPAAARLSPRTPQPPRRVPQVLSNAEEVVELYRELSRHPGLSAACLGPDVTTQYGGKYCSLYTGTARGGAGRHGAGGPAGDGGLRLPGGDLSSPPSSQSGRSGTWRGPRTSSSAAST